jgi:DNA polymerase-3 subunit alpha
MAKMKKLFFDKAKELGLTTEDEAHIIFDGVEKSQRYSFNAAHAVSYALNGYLSAYAKAHFPRAFYASYLYYAKGKINTAEEVRSLVANAKSVDIDICGPNLFLGNEKFQIFDQRVYFGLCDIKGVGKATYEKLQGLIQELPIYTDKEWTKLDWTEFLFYILLKLPSDDVSAIIKVGALDQFGVTRQQMLFDYEIAGNLTKGKEIPGCLLILKEHKDKNNDRSLKNVLVRMCSEKPGKAGFVANKKRLVEVQNLIKILENPPHSLNDNLAWIAANEHELLGVSMTVSEIEACDINAVNCTCREFSEGLKNKVYILAGKITKMKEIVTVNGKNPGQKMCFVSIEDQSGSLDSLVVFPDQFDSNKNLLVENNKIMVSGIRGKGDKENSLIVNKVWQI